MTGRGTLETFAAVPRSDDVGGRKWQVDSFENTRSWRMMMAHDSTPDSPELSEASVTALRSALGDVAADEVGDGFPAANSWESVGVGGTRTRAGAAIFFSA